MSNNKNFLRNILATASTLAITLAATDAMAGKVKTTKGSTNINLATNAANLDKAANEDALKLHTNDMNLKVQNAGLNDIRGIDINGKTNAKLEVGAQNFALGVVVDSTRQIKASDGANRKLQIKFTGNNILTLNGKINTPGAGFAGMGGGSKIQSKITGTAENATANDYSALGNIDFADKDGTVKFTFGAPATEIKSNIGSTTNAVGKLVIENKDSDINFSGNIGEHNALTSITVANKAHTRFSGNKVNAKDIVFGGADGGYIKFGNAGAGTEIISDNGIRGSAPNANYIQIDGKVTLNAALGDNIQAVKIEAGSVLSVKNKDINRKIRFLLRGNDTKIIFLGDGMNEYEVNAKIDGNNNAGGEGIIEVGDGVMQANVKFSGIIGGDRKVSKLLIKKDAKVTAAAAMNFAKISGAADANSAGIFMDENSEMTINNGANVNLNGAAINGVAINNGHLILLNRNTDSKIGNLYALKQVTIDGLDDALVHDVKAETLALKGNAKIKLNDKIKAENVTAQAGSKLVAVAATDANLDFNVGSAGNYVDIEFEAKKDLKISDNKTIYGKFIDGGAGFGDVNLAGAASKFYLQDGGSVGKVKGVGEFVADGAATVKDIIENITKLELKGDRTKTVSVEAAEIRAAEVLQSSHLKLAQALKFTGTYKADGAHIELNDHNLEFAAQAEFKGTKIDLGRKTMTLGANSKFEGMNVITLNYNSADLANYARVINNGLMDIVVGAGNEIKVVVTFDNLPADGEILNFFSTGKALSDASKDTVKIEYKGMLLGDLEAQPEANVGTVKFAKKPVAPAVAAPAVVAAPAPAVVAAPAPAAAPAAAAPAATTPAAPAAAAPAATTPAAPAPAAPAVVAPAVVAPAPAAPAAAAPAVVAPAVVAPAVVAPAVVAPAVVAPAVAAPAVVAPAVVAPAPAAAAPAEAKPVVKAEAPKAEAVKEDKTKETAKVDAKLVSSKDSKADDKAAIKSSSKDTTPADTKSPSEAVSPKQVSYFNEDVSSNVAQLKSTFNMSEDELFHAKKILEVMKSHNDKVSSKPAQSKSNADAKLSAQGPASGVSSEVTKAAVEQNKEYASIITSHLEPQIKTLFSQDTKVKSEEKKAASGTVDAIACAIVSANKTDAAIHHASFEALVETTSKHTGLDAARVAHAYDNISLGTKNVVEVVAQTIKTAKSTEEKQHVAAAAAPVKHAGDAIRAAMDTTNLRLVAVAPVLSAPVALPSAAPVGSGGGANVVAPAATNNTPAPSVKPGVNIINNNPTSSDLEAEAYGIAAGSSYDRFGAWVQAMGGVGNQKAHKGASGFKSNLVGSMLGVDTMINDSTIVGFAFGNVINNVKQQGIQKGDKTRSSSWVFSGYGNYQFENNWFIRGSAAYTKTAVDNQDFRTINLTKKGLARAKYNIDSFGAEFAIGKALRMNQDMVFTPTIGARFTHTGKISYQEKGNTGLNNKISQGATNFAQAILGMQLSKTYVQNGVMLTPDVHTNVAYGLGMKSPTGKYTNQVDSKTISYVGTKSSRFSASVGVGLTAEVGSVEYGVGYDANLSAGYVGHQGTLKLKVKF